MRKQLIKLFSLCLLVISTSTWAHSGGHGKVSEQQAVNLAFESVKKLTFKDYGLTIGKLDSSWNKVGKQAFELAEANEQQFIVKAKNDALKQEIFYIMSANGRIIDVVDKQAFKKEHGHHH